MNVPTSEARPLDRRALLLGTGTVAAAGLLMSHRGGEAAPVGAVRRLELLIPRLRMHVPGTPAGHLPEADVTPVPHGELFTADGVRVGALSARSVDGPVPQLAHTIELPDGDLTAVGPGDLAGPNTVVHGTGAYAGASGSFTVRGRGDGHVLVLLLHKGVR